MQAIREPMAVLDSALRIVTANFAFFRSLDIHTEPTEDSQSLQTDHKSWCTLELRQQLDHLLTHGGELKDFAIDAPISRLGGQHIVFHARRLDDPLSGQPLLLLSLENRTPANDAARQAEAHRQWLHTTLNSIGDAVIATDNDARVTFLNPTAQRLTGWDQNAALGRPLLEIFNIVNEDSRKLVESPVSKAIRMGMVVGLANHTILISRDGLEHPIDDSAAPIRDEVGNVIGVVLVFHDITERQAADRVQGRLVEIVESSDDAIIAKDLNGIVTDWNHGAERLFGYPAEEAVGQSITLIIPPERQNEETMVLERLRRGERTRHFETVRRRKNGSLVDISLSVSPIRNRRGEIIGASKVARDITERKRIEAELEAHLINEQSLRVEAESANRSKDLFLATLSHELRTPVNAIAGWVGLLRGEGCNDEDLKEGLEVIDRNIKAQVQLIDDVLDVSRIVSGKLQLKMQRCELASLIRAAIDTVRPATEAKSISIESNIEPAASPLACDAGRIQQVFWNLLSNAVKFTPKGGRIWLDLRRQESIVRLTVRDTGQGIIADFLPFVFDRFRQADSSTRRKFGGLGLGLSIVKQLVELHGGTVQAESKGPDQGATFTVDLPVSPIAVAPTLDATEEEKSLASESNLERLGSAINLEGLRIVVVDDEPDTRRIVARVLSEAGATVTPAGTVAEALQAIERSRPGLLISDIAMPEEDGYDLIRQVRAKGHTAQTLPAVALTAFADKSHARSALLAGYQVHLPKPIDSHDLVTVVASLTGRTA